VKEQRCQVPIAGWTWLASADLADSPISAA